MSTGGMAPSPESYGGRRQTTERIVESLSSQRGAAYDTSTDAIVYAEHLAIARALESVWSANQRLANQFDPDRMTEFLPRWERIFAIVPPTGATDVARRAAVKLAMQRIGSEPYYQSLFDLCTLMLGSSFVGIVHTTTAAGVNGPANVSWAAGGYAALDPTVTFSSTVAHVLIQVQQVAFQTDAEFYALVGTLGNPLNDFLPAWVTWDWFRLDSQFDVKGFYLDSPHNLDNSVFDV